MKRIKLLGIIAFSTLLTACGGSETAKENTEVAETTEVSTEGMQMVNLRDNGFEGAIYIPKDLGAQEITRTDWGSVRIKAGDHFGIEIQNEAISFDMKTSEIQDNQVYKIDFISQEPPLLFWKKSLPDGSLEDEYQFFYTYQEGGMNIEIKSFDSEIYSKSDIEKMIASAKTFSHEK